MAHNVSFIDMLLSSTFDRNARPMYQGPHSAALHARLCLQYGIIQRLKKEAAEQRVGELETKLGDTQGQLASVQEELAATQEALRTMTEGWERGEFIFSEQKDEVVEECNKADDDKTTSTSRSNVTTPLPTAKSPIHQDLELIERSNQDFMEFSAPEASLGWSPPAHVHFDCFSAAELLGEAMMEGEAMDEQNQAVSEWDAGAAEGEGKEKADSP